MAWVRFEGGFVTPEGNEIVPNHGDMFGAFEPSGAKLTLADVSFLAPVVPGKFVALRNNFHALAAKLGQATPQKPLSGDLIACGTSLGVLPMRSGAVVSVVIDGIGALTNRYEAAD